jgi:hypothetical protein
MCWPKRVSADRREGTEASMKFISKWPIPYSANSGIWWVVIIHHFISASIMLSHPLITDPRHIHCCSSYGDDVFSLGHYSTCQIKRSPVGSQQSTISVTFAFPPPSHPPHLISSSLLSSSVLSSSLMTSQLGVLHHGLSPYCLCDKLDQHWPGWWDPRTRPECGWGLGTGLHWERHHHSYHGRW